MKSSWDYTRQLSSYHFDSTKEDRYEDVIQYYRIMPMKNI